MIFDAPKYIDIQIVTKWRHLPKKKISLSPRKPICRPLSRKSGALTSISSWKSQQTLSPQPPPISSSPRVHLPHRCRRPWIRRPRHSSSIKRPRCLQRRGPHRRHRDLKVIYYDSDRGRGAGTGWRGWVEVERPHEPPPRGTTLANPAMLSRFPVPTAPGLASVGCVSLLVPVRKTR
jgi:hypothetical protein